MTSRISIFIWAHITAGAGCPSWPSCGVSTVGVIGEDGDHHNIVNEEGWWFIFSFAALATWWSYGLWSSVSHVLGLFFVLLTSSIWLFGFHEPYVHGIYSHSWWLRTCYMWLLSLFQAKGLQKMHDNLYYSNLWNRSFFLSYLPWELKVWRSLGHVLLLFYSQSIVCCGWVGYLYFDLDDISAQSIVANSSSYVHFCCFRNRINCIRYR